MNYKVVKIYVLKTRLDRLVRLVESRTKGQSDLGKGLKPVNNWSKPIKNM